MRNDSVMQRRQSAISGRTQFTKWQRENSRISPRNILVNSTASFAPYQFKYVRCHEKEIIGKGQAGIERQAYYAGWLLVDYWLRHGMSFTDIAGIPEEQMPVRVGDAIQKLLIEPSASR
jgi:hypothetical protein